MTERTFYGGEAPVLATTGEVGGDRHYQGAGLGEFGAWKCPACGKENTTQFEQGCPQCGAGAPGKHVGVEPPALDLRGIPAALMDVEPTTRPDYLAQPRTPTLFDAWWAKNEDTLVRLQTREVARLAFEFGCFSTHEATMKAPPVTADLPELSPQGKGRRTIIAALKHFRDTILIESPEETTTGEWCTTEEASALIAELEEKA